MKYLYNIGCSFSEGNGIAEDLGIDTSSAEGVELETKSRYSAVLSKKLGLIEINEAEGGGSNQRIFRKTWNWIAENPKLLSETIFVIQWSYPRRSEFYYSSTKKKWWWHTSYREVLEIKNLYFSDPKKGIHKLVLDMLNISKTHPNYDSVGFIPNSTITSKTTLRYVLSLQSFFKENNCKYLFFEGDRNMPEGCINWTSNLANLVDKDYFIEEDFLTFSGRELVLNGHPNVKSQRKWAEKLEKFIKDKNWLN
jgi:hypothetical protein